MEEHPLRVVTSRPRAGRRKHPCEAGPAYSRSERYRWDFDASMDIFRAAPTVATGTSYRCPWVRCRGSYSSDGKQIVFTSFRDGDAEIYIMDADGRIRAV